ncbi:MAG: glutamate--tRNA ligase family protein [Kiritimatiellae bacterium]|nr:glutamate--tRNA ligase family protein [Kiritimatiellia bacterium]
MSTRVRFAPSPTGQVHIGNMRAAIFNWLFARHTGGKFLLRIEDTDRERSTPEALQAIFTAMDWLGIEPDEPPVYQSARLAAHLETAEKLLSSGHAYRAPRTGKDGAPEGECVVFKMPGTDIIFRDAIKGQLRKAAADMKDFVIVRSNNTPVFHLANVADDIAMGITDIIRGDDHIENTYRHAAMFQALGAAVPQYAHLPMIVNAQGKPYSKRDGTAFVGEFREKGYLADVLFNYLALLGWSPGDDREILAREEMIRLFEISRVKSAPARVDLEKLSWMNGEYIKALPREILAEECRRILAGHGLWKPDADAGYAGEVFELMRPRIKIFPDIAALGAFFFTEDYPCDSAAVKKRLLTGDDILPRLLELNERFKKLEKFNAAASEQALRQYGAESGIGAGPLIHAVRVAVSGLAMGPGLFEMLAVLGKTRVTGRIARSVAMFSGPGT